MCNTKSKTQLPNCNHTQQTKTKIDQINYSNDTPKPISPKKSQPGEHPVKIPRATRVCVNCRHHHKKCGFERPCLKCKESGIECVEAPRVKRGVKKGISTGIRKQNNMHVNHPTPFMITTPTKQVNLSFTFEDLEEIAIPVLLLSDYKLISPGKLHLPPIPLKDWDMNQRSYCSDSI